MGFLATHDRGQAHHHGLGHDQPLAEAQVAAHLARIDHQAGKNELGLMQGPGRMHEALG